MKVELYEIDFTDVTTGKRTVKEVAGSELARQTAKALAKSSGKRVIVRKAPKRQWRVYVADLETGVVTRLEQKLSVSEAAIMFRQWNRTAKEENAVCIYWPQWAPELRLQITIAS